MTRLRLWLAARRASRAALRLHRERMGRILMLELDRANRPTGKW